MQEVFALPNKPFPIHFLPLYVKKKERREKEIKTERERRREKDQNTDKDLLAERERHPHKSKQAKSGRQRHRDKKHSQTGTYTKSVSQSVGVLSPVNHKGSHQG